MHKRYTALQMQYFNKLSNGAVPATEGAYEDNLKKSATMGYNVDPSTGLTVESGAGAASALRIENLDARLTTLSYGTDEFVLWRKLTRIQARGLVEQYDVLNSRGRFGHSQAVAEPDISAPVDPHLQRRIVNMKFFSDTNNATIASLINRNIEDVRQLWTDNAIERLVAGIEWQIFYGDSTLTSVGSFDKNSEGQGVEFDGLTRLIPDKNVLDARNKPLDGSMLNKASTIIRKAYGRASDVFMPVGAKATFIQSLPVTQLALMNNSAGATNTVGLNPQGFQSSNGVLALNGSATMEIKNILNDDELGALGQAMTPVVTAEVTKNDANSQFSDAEAGQTLNYKVVATAERGDSFAAPVSAALDAKTSSVALTIKVPAMGVLQPDYVSVYREFPSTGDFYLLARIGVNQAQSDGSIVFNDENDVIPGTVDVFVGDMSANVIQLYELLPFVELPLAQVNATYTWTILWYGALALRAPKRWVRIKNVQYMASESQY